jgi:hypothetical protein
VAERYGVGLHVVLNWIRNRELSAFSVASKAGARRPTWRITESALAAFEAARTASPEPPRKRRRKKREAYQLQYYA